MTDGPLESRGQQPPSPDPDGVDGLAGVRVRPVGVANEFADIRVSVIDTRNGIRLLVESPRTGQWVALCPLELEALTWQNTATFSAMISKSGSPLVEED